MTIRLIASYDRRKLVWNLFLDQGNCTFGRLGGKIVLEKFVDREFKIDTKEEFVIIF